MKKYIILLTWICCALPFYAKAQKELRLISSRDYEARKEWGVNRFYKPVFLHEGSTLSADSSDYSPEERFFDAFGNVVITQPNGTVVYADKLHYIKDSRIAILTNNVKMVDIKGAVLTTNHLTYNLNTKIGTYVDGGRIVNETDTLNSKNGSYFESSQDAYFRHDVIVRTPETNIFTDTLRYNSLSKMAYFYGPTNIKGKSGGNLYTENGDYHTETDRARFGKNNLYTEESKFLKGDSLYYDGKLGYGRAIKNVVFIDTAQQGILYGQRGIYLKKDESITMTEQAYMIMVTKSDSTQQADSADSIPIDSTLQHQISNDSLRTDTLLKDSTANAADSVYMAADTLYSRVIFLKDYNPIELNLRRDGGDLDEEEEEDFEASIPDSLENNDSNLSTDSLNISPTDSLEQITKDSIASNADSLRSVFHIDSLSANRPSDISADSLMKILSIDSAEKVPIKEPSEELIKKAIAETSKLQNDSTENSHRALIGVELAADSLLIDPKNMPILGQADSSLLLATQSAMNTTPKDSSSLDTARTRIVKAYHHMRIFKTDLQARADSAYYGYPDSIIRCYGNPMIWAQGSQLSGDTIYLQLKNQKLDNMLLKTNAFIVSTQLDSVKFNQVKGRKITGFFTDNKLERMFVDGNAESIYYTEEDKKISGMTKSIGSRIKILFEDNAVREIINIKKTETSYTPVAAFDPDKEILPGFIWKPKDRPESKEEIIHSVTLPNEPQADSLNSTGNSVRTDSVSSKKPVVNTNDGATKPIQHQLNQNETPGVKQEGIKPKSIPDSIATKEVPAIQN